jgi:phosphosulfolactate synthase
VRRDRKAPFAFVALPPERSSTKPRRSLLTMMVDFGLPYRTAEDIVDLAASHIDFARIAVGTSRLYDLVYLRRKLSLYKTNGIRPFIGGQFQEYVFAVHGTGARRGFMTEARRVGFDVIEISDNCVPLSDKQRFAQIRLAIDCGLKVFGEVGSKDAKSDASGLLRQAEPRTRRAMRRACCARPRSVSRPEQSLSLSKRRSSS